MIRALGRPALRGGLLCRVPRRDEAYRGVRLWMVRFAALRACEFFAFQINQAARWANLWVTSVKWV